MKLWHCSVCRHSNSNRIVPSCHHLSLTVLGTSTSTIIVHVTILHYLSVTSLFKWIAYVMCRSSEYKIVHMKAITPYRHALPTWAAPTHEHPNAQSMCPLQSCTTLFHDVIIQMHLSISRASVTSSKHKRVHMKAINPYRYAFPIRAAPIHVYNLCAHLDPALHFSVTP